MKRKPQVLIILDGFGYSTNHDSNAIYQANLVNFNSWLEDYPSSILKASGTHVGLLKGMIGNSEVGHLTIGSGRIIKQPVALITDSIKDGSFFNNSMLINHFKQVKNSDSTLHLMGLLSDAGVHSLDSHLFALLKMAASNGVKKIVVHPFLDGKDVPPKSAAIYLTKLEKVLIDLNLGTIGSIHGRFYAMDRDYNWDRIEASYRVLTQSQETTFVSWQKALQYFYHRNITDEFIPPTSLSNDTYIKPKDSLIFFNFRSDRAREITRAFIEPNFKEFKVYCNLLSWMVTGVLYHPDFHTDVLCHKELVINTFFDVLEKAEMRIFTIAETEKYAHVTYFFNGGREVIRPLETRILIPSQRKYTSYADAPQMSAQQITHSVISSLQNDPQDFYLINYANADMVGHSGNFHATCQAVKYLDEQLKKIYDVLIDKLDGTLYITSDHGKAEDMFDDQLNQVRTAHTNNPVPFLMINKQLKGQNYILPLEELSDIAPFILNKLNLLVPYEMLANVP